jgi:hypothetical protein
VLLWEPITFHFVLAPLVQSWLCCVSVLRGGFIMGHPSCCVVLSFIFVVELQFHSTCVNDSILFVGFHFLYTCPGVFHTTEKDTS